MGNTVEHGPFEVEFQHHARALARPAFIAIGKLRQHKGGGGRLSVRAVKGAGVWRSSERSGDP